MTKRRNTTNGRQRRAIARLGLAVTFTALVTGALASARPPQGGGGAETTEDVTDILEMLIDDVLDDSTPAPGEDELTLETLKFFIEFNETDEDIGVQTLLGGEPYKRLRAFDPCGKKILDVKPKGSLRKQGLSDFFHESAEPTLDEFSLEAFFDRFPEGEYEYETITLDGIEQDGETLFTHLVPAGPVITSPEEDDVVDRRRLVVEWEAVTLTTAFDPPQVPVDIVGYQVILTREDPLRVLSMDVGPDTTSVSVPPEWLDEGTEYELEILAIEESDNQTISIIFFETK